tara:strand:+ start:59 stop:331 length:273 start_codon:yes stop_codon:yes gene_type:complete
MLETIVCTLEISNSFTEWADKFDNEEAPGRQAKGIKVLYRGVSTDSANKVVVIVQAEEGVIAQHIGENLAFFTANGARMETASPQAFLDC